MCADCISVPRDGKIPPNIETKMADCDIYGDLRSLIYMYDTHRVSCIIGEPMGSADARSGWNSIDGR